MMIIQTMIIIEENPKKVKKENKVTVIPQVMMTKNTIQKNTINTKRIKTKNTEKDKISAKIINTITKKIILDIVITHIQMKNTVKVKTFNKNTEKKEAERISKKIKRKIERKVIKKIANPIKSLLELFKIKIEENSRKKRKVHWENMKKNIHRVINEGYEPNINYILLQLNLIIVN